MIPAGCCLLWAALWICGFPASHHDDAYFAGAGIQIARHSTLENPWLADWIGWVVDTKTRHYYLLPPFHPWLLGLWLKMAGISTAAFTGFACFCGLAGSLALSAILARRKVGRAGVIMSLLAFAAFLITRGIRPEVPGCALLLLGFWLMEMPSRPPRFAGAVLILAAPICHPFLLVFSVPALAWTIQHHVRRAPAASPALLADIAVAGLVNLALFGWAIRGDWPGFWHDFSAHAAFVRPTHADRWANYRGELLLGWERWPNLAILGSGAALGGWLFWRNPSLKVRVFCLGGFLLGLGVAGYWLYAQFSIAFVLLAVAIGAGTFAGTAGRRLDCLVLVPAAILVGWISFQQTLQVIANHEVPCPSAAIRSWIADNNPDAIGIDAYTLRHVFDFNPPGEVHLLDWSGAPGTSTGWWNPSALGARDVWITNPNILTNLTPMEVPRTSFSLFGRTLRSVRAKTAALLVLGPGLPPPKAETGIPFVFSDALHRASP